MRTYMSGEKNYEADMEPEEAAVYALQYFLSGTPYAKRDIDVDEDDLALVDYKLNKWPW
ncbi:hypothetical protein [Caldicoprobacter sp.]|uniref:hypothetical protein n=1 Tax=Caldicoprobacter sp. TaxID=2004500 RepID=UPI0039C334E8